MYYLRFAQFLTFSILCNINVGSCLFTCFAASDLILYHFRPQDKYGLTFLMLDVSGFEVDLRNTMRRDIKVW